MSDMRLSLKVINNELERRSVRAVLTKGDGYFYFWGGEATDWLDRTVRVPTLHSLTLEQWVEQYRILEEKNLALLTGGTKQKKQLADPATDKPDTERREDRQIPEGERQHKKSEPRQGNKT